MFETLKRFYYKLKFYNRKRLDIKRGWSLSKDAPHNKTKPFPEKIQRILFIATSGGLGDAIYISGLFKALADDGYTIEVATMWWGLPRFKHLPFIEKYFDLANKKACDEAIAKKPDILIDLEWINKNHWDFRKYLLTQTNCFKVTTSYLLEDMNIFNHYLDYSRVEHMSERLALTRTLINGEQSTPIRPYIEISDAEHTQATEFIRKIRPTNTKILYLNGIAGESDRCLSTDQISAILTELKAYPDIKILMPSKEYSKFKSDQLVKLPKTSFTGFCAILKRCDYIISVDTSVVHIASAYNIPAIAFFSPNDRDHFVKFAQAEVWSPTSDHSYTERFDDPDLIIYDYGFGIKNRRMRDMNTIPPAVLAERVRKDMEELYNLK